MINRGTAGDIFFSITGKFHPQILYSWAELNFIPFNLISQAEKNYYKRKATLCLIPDEIAGAYQEKEQEAEAERYMEEVAEQETKWGEQKI